MLVTVVYSRPNFFAHTESRLARDFTLFTRKLWLLERIALQSRWFDRKSNFHSDARHLRTPFRREKRRIIIKVISVTHSPFSRVFITRAPRCRSQAECRSTSAREENKRERNPELYLYSPRGYDHNRKHVTARIMQMWWILWFNIAHCVAIRKGKE